jgi:sugar lactone lactonase YvrE
MIYVANYGGFEHRGKILVYAVGAHGDVKAVRSVKGSKTLLTGLTDVALDADDNLYVPTSYRNTVNVYAAGASGDAPPIRQISGSNTGLSSPVSVAVDADGDLYVTNVNQNEPPFRITIYAAGANGNVAPLRTIAGSNTLLAYPYGIALDSAQNIYVANSSNAGCVSSVVVYAAGSNGNVAPTQAIAGPNTGLNCSTGIAVDATDNIYVANWPGTVTIYAAGATGDVAPIQTITGRDTHMGLNTGIAVH